MSKITKKHIFQIRPNRSSNSKTIASPSLVSGFTMVESLVAITILSLAIMGASTAVQVGIKAANNAKSELTGFYLATEAIEYIKNTRETNALLGNDWLFGLNDCIGSDCNIDPTVAINNITPCVGGCDYLNVNDDSSSDLFGIYSYQTGSDWDTTDLIRKVRIEELGTDREIKVTSEVSWLDRGQVKEVTIVEHLFNWVTVN